MPDPKISIITSFFNTKDFLGEAIESVLKQDYQDWELLLVDDGSNDGSSEIARGYAVSDSRIIYLEHANHSNKGVSASRELAFTKSKGKYIAVLDADDVWKHHKLNAQLSIMESNSEIDLLCEASLYWFSWSKNQDSKDIQIPVGAPQDRLFNPPELMMLLYPLGKGAAPCPSGVMFRRNALQSTGGFDNGFTGDYQSYEDQALLTKFYLHKKVFVSSGCNNLYRQRTGSLVFTTHEQLKYRRVRKFYLDWLQQYLKEKNFHDPGIQREIRRSFFTYKFPLLHRITRKFAKGLALLLKIGNR